MCEKLGAGIGYGLGFALRRPSGGWPLSNSEFLPSAPLRIARARRLGLNVYVASVVLDGRFSNNSHSGERRCR